MPIQVRPKAISAAVAAFFALSIVGMWTNQSTFTCCKRALIGAALAYIAVSIAVNIINAIIRHAIIESHTNRQKEQQRV
jgi:predicted branched-subunit amino acid permease